MTPLEQMTENWMEMLAMYCLVYYEADRMKYPPSDDEDVISLIDECISDTLGKLPGLVGDDMWQVDGIVNYLEYRLLLHIYDEEHIKDIPEGYSHYQSIWEHIKSERFKLKKV